eukprot:c17479_g2_i1 orf=417-569(+)
MLLRYLNKRGEKLLSKIQTAIVILKMECVPVGIVSYDIAAASTEHLSLYP